MGVEKKLFSAEVTLFPLIFLLYRKQINGLHLNMETSINNE